MKDEKVSTFLFPIAVYSLTTEAHRTQSVWRFIKKAKFQCYIPHL